ncbi:MAG: PAS domain S-box protein, partial [Nitrospirales bacterium]|nr:PAS domain S-box protein [Nitrospirales bacterium]
SCARVLRAELTPEKLRGKEIAIGTATDPYQPAELQFGVTRSILQVLANCPELEDYLPTVEGERFFQYRCVPECGPDGAVRNVLVVSHDLTERKIMEEELRVAQDELKTRVQERTAELEEVNERLIGEISERKSTGKALKELNETLEQRVEERTQALRTASAYNRSLIEASLDPLLTISPEGKISDVNTATEKATGYSREELIGREFADCFTEPDRAREGYTRVLSAGEVTDYFLVMRHRDGHITPVLWNVSLFKDGGGRVAGIFAAARTIDTMLRISEKKLRDITNALGEGVFVLDYEGKLTFMNPEAERLLRCSADTVPGIAGHDLIHGRRGSGHAAEDCPILKVLQTGSMIRGEDESFTRWDGTAFPVSYISAPIMEEEMVVAVVTAFHDITERKEMEERLMQYTSALERSNKELEQFAYVASHDLQEPLRRVISFTELLSQRYSGQLDEKADTYIRFIVSGAMRMSNLINDLLAYSRVTARGDGLAPTNMTSVVAGVLKELSVVIEESGAVITMDKLPRVTADAAQIGQVFLNLINNAIKFRGEGRPVIHISAMPIEEILRGGQSLQPEVMQHLQEAGKGWVFSVSDRGIGIEPQYYDRIFQIFQRLHTQEEYPGTGIGLAVCKKVVERHGGKIWVESGPEKGTTFSFTLLQTGY